MQAQLGKFLKEVVCEVGKSAVAHWLSGSGHEQKEQAAQHWARSHAVEVGAFSVHEAAKMLAGHGVKECSKDTLLSCAGTLFACTCEGIDFALKSVVEVPGIAEHMHDQLFNDPDAAAAFLAHADSTLDALNQGQLVEEAREVS